jgi:benzoate-CoA ligase
VDAVTPGGFTRHHEPAADDFAFMLYSSGSTGRLKGVPHRHASLLLPCELMGEGVLGIRGDDLIFSTSKLSFGYGLVNSFSFPLWFGAPAILHPEKPEVGAVLEIMERYRPSIMFSVPTVYAQILLACAEPTLCMPMRLCCSAGEALPALLFEEWQRLTGLEIIDGIGASELSHHFMCNLPGEAVPGSAGRVVPGYEVRLVDDAGNAVSEGQEGHLLVSGGTRAPCYWNLPELSRVTMLPDGFTRTGDIMLQRGGQYYFRGRSDDMIKVDAQWVAPVVVEAALLSHPAVAECAVAAVTVGPLVRPGAFLVLVPGTDWTPVLARELRTHVAARLPDYMCPARFRVLDLLPRTTTGKIQRFRLRELT